MTDSKLTASAIINFAEKLEDDSSNFYEKLAERFAESRTVFLSFVEESKKNKVLVTRTYRETITDALEACFSFEDFSLNIYAVKANLTKETSYTEALRMAIKLEENVSKFYLDAAEFSKCLLATIPSAFRKVAERRNCRKQLLKSLLDKTASQH
jgi:rubrerythrin